MWISMTLLAQELADHITEIHITEKTPGGISGMKILTSDAFPLDPENVYFCQPSQLSMLPEDRSGLTGRNLVICGEEYAFAEQALSDCNYLSVSSRAGFFYFINAAEQIFASYNDWENRLTAAASSDAPLQELLEIVYEKIRCPLCMLDAYHHVLAITPKTPTSDPLFTSMLNGYGYQAYELIQNSNPHLPDLNIEPVVDVINSISRNRLRVVAIHLHGKVVAFLGLHKTDTQHFTPAVLELVDFCMPILKSCIERHPPQTYVRSSLFDQFMADLIAENIPSEQSLNRFLSSFGLNAYDNYKLFALKGPLDMEREADRIYKFMNRAEEQLPNTRCFFCEPYIGLLVRSCDWQTWMPALRGLLTPLLICTEGSEFSYIRDISRVWALLDDAFRHEAMPEDGFLTTDHALLRQCREAVLSAVPAETMMHPYFWLLQAFDRENRTEYLPTLICYLLHNCHMADTAAALFIHRNSLQYRLKKIEELLDIRIATCPERADMLFSALLLAEPEQTRKGGTDAH